MVPPRNDSHIVVSVWDKNAAVGENPAAQLKTARWLASSVSQRLDERMQPTPLADGKSAIYQRPVELLQMLIQFDTANPPGNESECISFINGVLTEAGIGTKVLVQSPERPKFIARLSGQGKVPPLLLYGHVDVATTEDQQWKHPPSEGKLVDEFVWGRGALDMKGVVSVMIG